MQMAAFLSLVTQKGVIAVSERCKEYYINKTKETEEPGISAEEASKALKDAVTATLASLNDDEKEILKLAGQLRDLTEADVPTPDVAPSGP